MSDIGRARYCRLSAAPQRVVPDDYLDRVVGSVTGPNDSRENPFGDGAQTLHDWLFDAATDDDRALLQDGVNGTGAIVMGRKSFDKCVDMWGDSGPLNGVPCFVVTHNEPIRAHPSVYRFVTEGVATAIKLAQDAAGD